MIRHVLNDGTHVDSVAGRMIKATDNRQLYEAVSTIKKEGGENNVMCKTVPTPNQCTGNG